MQNPTNNGGNGGGGNGNGQPQMMYQQSPYGMSGNGQPGGMPHMDPTQQAQFQQHAMRAQLQHQQLAAYQMQTHHVAQQHQLQLRTFWQGQMREIETGSDFKNHQLPLARIKKIMKSDEDVRMISSEAPVLFAKACEMFILELTLRSWIHSEENKRRTLQRNDIAAAITKTDIFDFLVDIVPRDDFKEEGMNVQRAQGGAGVGEGGGGIASVPYNPGMYYMQPPPGGMPPGAQWPGGMGGDPNQWKPTQ
jgi:nuclear transcription factor Y gamma|tara:strand:- start:559 stop:1305 length:747 start_codon:yes stop_codon:yes gene_type:complete|mmetsp:Transcript_9921/g.36053  ORF Transcript_9921/g.36053 Transcript_9921/m.36053 type:complete len:249 (-) Transcript_9921:41-787(-)